MHHDTSILVLGAGELGMAVLRNLVRRVGKTSGVSISVLLRPSTLTSDSPGKQKDIAQLRALGVDIVPGDLVAQSDAALADIFARFDTVISCTGFVGGPGVQLKIARAALDAGVRRYFPWQFGVDYDVIGKGSAQDLFDEQLDVRTLLRSQEKTEWVIVSTGMFMSFLFEPSFGVVDMKSNSVHALGSWDNAVTVTTAEDIGALTSEILLTKPRIVNQVVHVAGDTVTYRRLADALDTLLNRKLDRAEWSVEALKRELAEAPNDPIRKYRVVFSEGRGVAWDKARTFNAQRGLGVVGLEEWMDRHLSVDQFAAI
ncbi:aromatic alcohol reductase [Paraburkholderia bengalensis]|uniref:Aromatic alcohol reductase n=1 Tax=Paraburkholderia bengalensis TaxID=2747562 RepID=A0ABU8J335_9BURK